MGGDRVAHRPFPGRTALILLLAFLFGCAGLARPLPSTGGAAPAPPPAPEPPSPGLPARGGTPLPPPPAPPPIRTVVRVTLGAVGDVLMQDAVKRSAEAHASEAPDGGYSWLFAPVADLLAQPDLTFANLESPVAPAASTGSRPFVFDAPPEAIAALRRAGIGLVSVANNHALDQGRAGLEETVRWLEAGGLPQVGAGVGPRRAGPVRLERKGLSLAFLAYTYGLNQGGNACPAERPACVQVSELDRERIVEDVRAAAAGADAVVVSIHWGTEYQPQPRAEDVELAHRLADAGALVLLGHHPHVLQPVELYRRPDGRTAVIAYSLGNFVSNQSRGFVPGVTPDAVAATRDGVLLRVALERRDYGRGVTRVEVAGADVLPLWTENDTAEIDPRREPARRPAIRVVADERALAEVRADLARLPDPVPAGAEGRFVLLRQREALYAARRAAAGAVLGEDLLRTLAARELARPGAGAAPDAAAAAPAAGRATPSAGP